MSDPKSSPPSLSPTSSPPSARAAGMPMWQQILIGVVVLFFVLWLLGIFPGTGVSQPPNLVRGCTDPTAQNYNRGADENDGTCIGAGSQTRPGCMDEDAKNWDQFATEEDDSCEYPIKGCMDDTADNFNAEAEEEDGSCTYTPRITYNPCPTAFPFLKRWKGKVYCFDKEDGGDAGTVKKSEVWQYCKSVNEPYQDNGWGSSATEERCMAECKKRGQQHCAYNYTGCYGGSGPIARSYNAPSGTPDPHNSFTNVMSWPPPPSAPADSVPGTLFHTTRCNACGIDWCGNYELHAQNKKYSNSGKTLQARGCDGVTSAWRSVRDSGTKAVYAVPPSPRSEKDMIMHVPQNPFKAGEEIALWNPHWKKFIKMQGNTMMLSPEVSDGRLPSTWTREVFTLISTGQVWHGHTVFGIWNMIERRYVRMPEHNANGKRMNATNHQFNNPTMMPAGMGWEKFVFVPQGNGLYAVRCPFTGSGGLYMRENGTMNYVDAADHNGGWQHFKVINANSCQKGGRKFVAAASVSQYEAAWQVCSVTMDIAMNEQFLGSEYGKDEPSCEAAHIHFDNLGTGACQSGFIKQENLNPDDIQGCKQRCIDDPSCNFIGFSHHGVDFGQCRDDHSRDRCTQYSEASPKGACVLYKDTCERRWPFNSNGLTIYKKVGA